MTPGKSGEHYKPLLNRSAEIMTAVSPSKLWRNLVVDVTVCTGGAFKMWLHYEDSAHMNQLTSLWRE